MTNRPKSRKRKTKLIPVQGLTGQRGVNLIERIVLEMGSRWTASGPNEVGIDGYIELFDPSSREALGLTVAVQSKVVSAIAEDSKETFDYWCDAIDLEYWLNGNTPVILIVSSPQTNEAYWVSVKDFFKDWTPADSARATFSKSKDKFDKNSFRQLTLVAAPKAGLYLAPTRREEILHTNLLSLKDWPPRIFIADTECRSPHDVWTLLRSSQREADAGWLLWEKKIISFHELDEAPWSSICDSGTLEAFGTSDWVVSGDPQRHRIFVQLLNQTLKAQLSPKVWYFSKEDCYAVVGAPRKLTYQSLKRPSAISVVSQFASVSNGRQFEWRRHIAFQGQFKPLEGQWYLEITPTYRFTTDGYALDRFHNDRLKGIKRIEGNRAVLSTVLFWADYLKHKESLFGSYVPLVFGDLLTFDCSVGIIDQDWLSDDSIVGREVFGDKALFLPDFENGISK
jgi:hypothetical protein